MWVFTDIRDDLKEKQMVVAGCVESESGDIDGAIKSRPVGRWATRAELRYASGIECVMAVEAL